MMKTLKATLVVVALIAGAYAEPAAPLAAEPLAAPIAAPIAEPLAAPIAEPKAAEPLAAPIAEPKAAEPLAAPIAEPKAAEPMAPMAAPKAAEPLAAPMAAPKAAEPKAAEPMAPMEPKAAEPMAPMAPKVAEPMAPVAAAPMAPHAAAPMAPMEPKAAEPMAPMEPKAAAPMAPMAPHAAAPMAPMAPKAAEPMAPMAPKAAEPMAPMAPKAAEPMAPMEPKAAAPMAPMAPKAAEPMAPMAPKAAEPMAPMAPKAAAPMAPMAPKAAEPMAPMAPKAAEPMAPMAPSAGGPAGKGKNAGKDSVIPEAISFPALTGLKGGDEVKDIDLGKAPSGKKAIVAVDLVDSNGKRIRTLFGPAKYPTKKINVKLPKLFAALTGAKLVFVTIAKDGSVLIPKDECTSCTSSAFNVAVGGTDATKIKEHKKAPPKGTKSVNKEDTKFYLKVIREQGNDAGKKKLSKSEAKQVLLGLDQSGLTATDASEIIEDLKEVYDEAGGKPDADEIAVLVVILKKRLESVDSIQPVLDSDQSAAAVALIIKYLKALALTADKKFTTLLTAAETAANTIQSLLEQLRAVSAATDINAGNIDNANVCSAPVTVATGGTFCSGGTYPIETILAGAGLPINLNRVTSVYITKGEMDTQDQTLINTLDLTAGASPHFAAVAAPSTVEPTAHTLTSKFDSATAGFEEAKDSTYNCFQRQTTANGEPSGTYTQIAAAQEVRTATTVVCQGANSGNIRWVTLAKAVTAPTTTTTTSGTSTISTPSTPSTTAAAATTASSDDGSSTSGVIGGIFGGVACLLIILALVALVLFKNKGSKGNAGYQNDQGYYSNGDYKVPAGTPV